MLFASLLSLIHISTEEFVKEGFFDGTLYENAMLDKLREACGLTDDEKLSLTSFEDYTKALSLIHICVGGRGDHDL